MLIKIYVKLFELDEMLITMKILGTGTIEPLLNGHL